MIDTITEKLQDVIFTYLVAPILQLVNPNGNTTGAYIAVRTFARMLVYGFLACLVASLLGVKKMIDKKMRWAQL